MAFFIIGVIACCVAIFVKAVRGDYDNNDDEYWRP